MSRRSRTLRIPHSAVILGYNYARYTYSLGSTISTIRVIPARSSVYRRNLLKQLSSGLFPSLLLSPSFSNRPLRLYVSCEDHLEHSPGHLALQNTHRNFVEYRFYSEGNVSKLVITRCSDRACSTYLRVLSGCHVKSAGSS